MVFEWDEAKAEINERKHGLSFEVAIDVFTDVNRTERLATHGSPSEERWTTTGLIEGTEVFVVYTMRGQAVRVISARRASRYEREAYWNR